MTTVAYLCNASRKGSNCCDIISLQIKGCFPCTERWAVGCLRKSAIRYSNKAKSPASPEEASCINTVDLSIRTTAWYGPCIDSQQLLRQTNNKLTPRGQVVASTPRPPARSLLGYHGNQGRQLALGCFRTSTCKRQWRMTEPATGTGRIFSNRRRGEGGG